tara:strand:- start:210922 stop:211707 length:786 start_codon:yes stop_codon:yes gene_type:complete
MHRPHYLLLLAALFACVANASQEYRYQVLDKKPQSRDIFVQGLQIVDDKLYVSGGGYGKSRLLRYDFSSGELELERQIDPRLWAEGLTVFNDRLYLLTWKSRNLFVYSKNELQNIERLQIPGEGWGLTHNGQQLIYSDGSDALFYLSPSEHSITRTLRVTENGKPLVRLNELEWIDGSIWANVWLTDRIVIINPENGKVEGSINLRGLLPLLERRADTDVLNGIALNPADGGIWVTGKNWPWMYRIELVPVTAPHPVTESR